jgi:lysosomal Pro-X carboxypeptidase
MKRWWMMIRVIGTVSTILVLVLVRKGEALATMRRRFAHPIPLHSPGMTESCTELYFEQRINHFAPTLAQPQEDVSTFLQRYFLNDELYQPGGPMFFYLGNEADVTLYVNATGLMWENAREFGALLVFAEHRYYGKSLLFPPSETMQHDHDDDDDHPSTRDLRFLSSEQALEDYVHLIYHLKEAYQFKETDAVIGFGGSYGGMLASWARFKYPHVWDGAIAASAPIVSFEGMQFDANFYAEGVTYDVTTAAGASEFCETNLRKAFADKALTTVLLNPNLLRSAFSVCPDDNTTNADLGWSATTWINEALSYMSMGNFPYESSYILNGNGVLPAFPVRVACQHLATNMTGEHQVDEWLAGLAAFAGVYYNYTQQLECNRFSAPVNNESQMVNRLWNYQYCSEIFQVFGQETSAQDMYWDAPWDGDAAAQNCFDQYGFYPNRRHFTESYGVPHDWARTASNIVWSQGEYDPWKGGGVTEDLNDSLLAILIAEAAHHLDLFFSHENDTQAVISARQIEMNQVNKWIHEKRASTHAFREPLREWIDKGTTVSWRLGNAHSGTPRTSAQSD